VPTATPSPRSTPKPCKPNTTQRTSKCLSCPLTGAVVTSPIRRRGVRQR
jgi:hypothetical protein